MVFRSLKLAALIAAAGSLVLGGSAAGAQSPTVRNVVLVSIPGHPSDRAPFYAVFSTRGRLVRARDSENNLRYPGGVGIDGPAAMNIEDIAPHGHRDGRWCYAAEASFRVWHKLHAGREYRVQIALSNDRSAPRTKATRKIRTRTIQDAAAALGC
jgi:hypothetical protein